MGFFQKSLLFLPPLLASGLVTSGSALAEACTYGEAIMALEQGNTVRGMVLMHMANRDGDERANRYLVLGGHQFGKIEMTARNLSQQPLLSLNRVNP